MIHSLYKTTNTQSGRFYIGVHAERKYPYIDDYMGSGKALNEDIEKLGPENFMRTILVWCPSSEYAYSLERQIVTQEFVDREDTYNMSIGGAGGVVGMTSAPKVVVCYKVGHHVYPTIERAAKAWTVSPEKARIRFNEPVRFPDWKIIEVEPPTTTPAPRTLYRTRWDVYPSLEAAARAWSISVAKARKRFYSTNRYPDWQVITPPFRTKSSP